MISDSSFNDEMIENIAKPDFLSESNISDNLSFISNNDKTYDFGFSNTLDFTDNLFRDSFCDTLKTKHYISKALDDKIRILRQLQNEANYVRTKHNKSKFVLETMDEVFHCDSTKLFKTIKEKCAKKLKFGKLMQTLDYNTNILESINIKVSPNEFSLSPEEKSMLRLAFREPFTKKLFDLRSESKIVSDFFENQPHSITLPGSILTEEKALVLNAVDNISEIVSSCNEEQIKIVNSINLIQKTWESKFKELYEKEVDCLEKKIKLLELKMKNLNYMIENAIVQQDENINEAVDILHKELNEAMDKVRYSVEKLRIKEKEYENLKGTKFDSILQEFIELRESYKHKCWALQQMQSGV